MSEMNDIVKLAVDAYNGEVEKYSVKESMETLRKALVEANGGSTVLDYRRIRDGKCVGLFSLIEEILSRTVVDGLQQNDFFNSLVDFRNVAEGDQNVFVVEDVNLFSVDKVAEGTQGVRRQRLSGPTEVTIPTVRRIARIYEELNRVLAGRVDFNHLINKVGESFKQAILNDTLTLWETATATQLGGNEYAIGGTYTEANMLNLIENVEAASGGMNVTIVGTKKAIRNLAMSIQSDGAKEDLYRMGYYGNFFGSPVIAVPQRYKVGTKTFVMNDNMLTVFATGERPLKVVYEGDPLVIMGDPLLNADLTQEYVYSEKWGTGVVLAGGNAGVGRYIITQGT